MKFYKALIFTTTFLFCAFISRSQISEAVCRELPDSLWPANRLSLTIIEKRNLLHFGSFFLEKDKLAELLPIAASLEQQNKTEKNWKEKVESLNAIFTYFFNNEDLNAYSLKYCDELLSLLKGRENYEIYWETLTSKGFLLGNAHEYEEGTDILIRALEHYREKKDSLGISDVSMYLAQSYYDLDLYEKAIGYAKIAHDYLKHDNLWSQRHMQIKAEMGVFYLNLCKRGAAGDICKEAEALLISVLHDKAPEAIYWKSYCYSNLSWKKYLDKQYHVSIAYADSALLARYLDEDTYPLLSRNTANAYKGLSLLSLGNKAEGKRLLKGVIKEYDSCITCSRKSKVYIDVAHELYAIARAEGKWEEALYYYEKYEHVKDTVNVIGNRGEMVIAKQKYDVSARDVKIRSLELDQQLNREKQSRNVLIIVVMVLLLVSVILLFYNRQRKNRIRQLEDSKAIQEEKRLHNEDLIRLEHNMVRLQQDAVMSQRKKISDDMHDDLSSSLAGLRFYIADIKAGSHSQEVKEAMTDIEQEVTTIYQNARQYMHSLKQNTQLQYDLAGYLKELKAKMAENATLFFDVQFNAGDVKSKLSADQHYHLYHIIREAIANIVKHASANRAFVHVDINEDTCSFMIGDNGKGFDRQATAGLSSGMGLQSLERRVMDMDGRIEIISDKKGTIIRGTFPLYSGLQHS